MIKIKVNLNLVFSIVLLLLFKIVQGQNKIAIDKVTGFNIYKFENTKEYYNCDRWMLCMKYPHLTVEGNQVVSVALDFAKANEHKLYLIEVKLRTYTKILETLTSKYGKPKKSEDLVTLEFNPERVENIVSYIWSGNKIQIFFKVIDDYGFVTYQKIDSAEL